MYSWELFVVVPLLFIAARIGGVIFVAGSGEQVLRGKIRAVLGVAIRRLLRW